MIGIKLLYNLHVYDSLGFIFSLLFKSFFVVFKELACSTSLDDLLLMSWLRHVLLHHFSSTNAC
jgi:hypothetical protein